MSLFEAWLEVQLHNFSSSFEEKDLEELATSVTLGAITMANSLIIYVKVTVCWLESLPHH